ncbi:MAG: primosomal protein N' [Desulfuromonadales bacterium]|nr:primosomal protein N' [Desulfuromonadales bacterium]
MSKDSSSLPVALVAVLAPLPRPLSYRVPSRLADRLQIGSRVRVPLGRRQAIGYVVELSAAAEGDLREIGELLDDRPLFNAGHAAFYRKAADYYAYPVGEAVRTALPAGLSGRGAQPVILSDRLYRPTEHDDPGRGPRQQELLAAIRARGSRLLSELRQQFPAPHATLNRLVELGLLTVDTVERRRDPFASDIVPHPPPALNPEQQQALAELAELVDQLPAFAPVLLHGVTGSGKTEVYLQTIAMILARGRQALVLVPEIALTPQLVARFRGRFAAAGVRLAVLHSGLSDGERFDAWRAAIAGEIDVIIGARSAIFAPLPRLGLIVVDEEHDASYKQSEAFRYNARDLALLRGQQDGAIVLLGSATPALTSYRHAHDGRYRFLRLPQRSSGQPLPEIALVDLSGAPLAGGLSPELGQALADTVTAGEQALLLLNRRGYAPFLLCHDCGATLRCPNCAITLTYSRVEQGLRCHYCDFRLRPPETCERCHGANLLPEGQGTERLEEEVRELLPEARVARMDRDTTTRKGAHLRLVEQMARGEIDVLIGTQMIAKGHDFPAVTLVGVLNADTGLNLPDFRSAERMFALLSQVAGRAGRGTRLGRVLIQTFNPDHHTFDHVVRHDYQGFAEQELAQREALDYPPFGHLVNLVLAGNEPSKVEAAAAELAARLQQQAGAVEILGPAPCLLVRLRGKHRVQILLKARHRPPLRRLIERLQRSELRPSAGVTLTLDIDPLDMF